MTTVLLVDDDKTLGQTVTSFLRLEDVDVVVTRDVENLIEITTETAPDVIVIDIMLAALSGVEVAAALRESPFADTPRIAVSSSPFLLEIAEESDLFAHVLSKPLDLEQLLVLILETVPQSERGSCEKPTSAP